VLCNAAAVQTQKNLSSATHAYAYLQTRLMMRKLLCVHAQIKASVSVKDWALIAASGSLTSKSYTTAHSKQTQQRTTLAIR
jgi:hypothetical protein